MSSPSKETRDVGLLSTGRVDAFSDGVFAIAITVLVLELKIPEGGDLPRELASAWPSYLGYFVSFAFIGAVWMAHSTLSKFLKAVDQVFLGLNLILLLLVSLLPFTSGLMASNLTDSGERLAVAIFGLNLTLASGMVNVLVRYASRTPGLSDRVGDQEMKAFARQRRLAIAVQAIATVLALVAPYVAVACYLVVTLLALLSPVARAWSKRREVAT